MDAVPAPRITSSKENKSEPAVKGRWLVAPPPPSIRSMQTQWHGRVSSLVRGWMVGLRFAPVPALTLTHSLNSDDGEPSQVSHSARGPLHGKGFPVPCVACCIGRCHLRWIESGLAGDGDNCRVKRFQPECLDCKESSWRSLISHQRPITTTNTVPSSTAALSQAES